MRQNLLVRLLSKWYDGSIEEIVDDWKWIFGYSARYKWVILYYVVLGIINTTVGLVSAIVSKYLIDIVTGYQTNKLPILLIAMVGSSMFTVITSNVQNRISTKIIIRIKNDIEADIFDQIVDADWLAISKYSNGDLLARFHGDVSAVSNNAINWIPSVVIAFYNFIATFLVILHYDVIMALLAFGSAPFMALLSRYVIKKQRDYGEKMREVSSGLMSFHSETFYNFDVIKSFGIINQYSKKLRFWQNEYKDASLDYNLFSIKTSIFMQGIGTLVSMVAFCYCLYRLWTHDISYGTMSLFLSRRSALTGAFNSIVSFIPSMITSSVSAHRVRELIELPKEEHIEKSIELDKYLSTGICVHMDDVDFSYVEGEKVLRDSFFEANPGEIVALVGPSGEGKTTMIRLMLGLIHPEDGDVILTSKEGNVSVDANVETRKLISYVPQGNSIISGTILDNMRMAKEDATEEEVIDALKVACAWDFIQKLPEGIHASVGERGKGLSEGQAQRISIARAVLRDAPILLLDEATSALDVKTERDVLRNIIVQRPNKTCIVTTHRPSVLNMCERVYRVMEKQVTQLSEEEASKMAMDF